jgi:tetratricopeptide (TPR) repeat protein
MQIKPYVISIFCFLLIRCVSYGQSYYDYNSELKEAYGHILQLNTLKAKGQLLQIQREQPHNLASLHIENYIDFFTVFLREEDEDLSRLISNADGRLSTLKDLNVASPYHRFAQAEIHLQVALARSKFGQYIQSGWEVNKAYKLLVKNQELYPDFILNQKSLSIIHALMGSLKGIQKVLISLFTSLDGDVSLGLKEIDQLYTVTINDQGNLFYPEIMAIKALITHHVEKQGNLAISILENEYLDSLNSPLIYFVRASLLLQNNRETEALSQLEKAVHIKSELPFAYIHLMRGICQLHQLDPKADGEMRYFLNTFSGRHYRKEALQKLAWFELLINDDEKEYKKYMKQCLIVGHTELGEDEEAQKEAEQMIVPNKLLLKARVLSDGSYFDRALVVMKDVNQSRLNEEDAIEYNYRLGRIYQGMKYDDLALNYYEKVVAQSQKDDRYYPCNAALQSGIIYYNNNQLKSAKTMFQKCLSIKPNQHRKSLHQKAESWIEKMK